MKALLKVTKFEKANNGVETVHLEAENSNPGNPANDAHNTYSKGETPAASMDITVSNPNEFGFFVEGKSYQIELAK